MRHFGFVCLFALTGFLASGLVFAQDDSGTDERMQEALQALGDGEFAVAAKLFRAVVDDDAKNGRAWHLMGYALHSNGQLDDAIKAHEKAATFDEFKGIALYNLCCAYSLKEDPKKSLDCLAKAFEAGFANFDHMSSDSDLDNIRELDRYQELVAKASEITEHGEDGEGHGEASESGEAEVEEMMNRAGELLGNGDFLDAAEVYHQVVTVAPKNGRAWFQLGYCLHAGGELDKAMEVHKKAASFEAFAGIATYNLGCALSLKKEVDHAFKALNKAAELGYVNVAQYESDTDLDNLREDERFAALMANVRNHADRVADKDVADKDMEKKKAKEKVKHDAKGNGDG